MKCVAAPVTCGEDADRVGHTHAADEDRGHRVNNAAKGFTSAPKRASAVAVVAAVRCAPGCASQDVDSTGTQAAGAQMYARCTHRQAAAIAASRDRAYALRDRWRGTRAIRFPQTTQSIMDVVEV